MRRLNDDLCRAHGLSVIEHPKERTKPEGEAAAIKYGISFKEQLRQTIDRMIPDCRDYDDFLARMRAVGYEIKEGKQLSFRAPGQERFTRSCRLGADYTKETLRERSATRRGYAAAAKKPVQRTGQKINLLIDIQAKMAAGKGAGYERWAKIFNLKEAAKTLNFLIENGLTDYDELTSRAEQAGTRFDETSRRIKQLEARMAEVAQLSQEYAALLAEKQERYAEYKELRQDMIDYRTMKQNVDKVPGLVPEEQEQQRPER
ncbi:hypothetical protein [Flintibacter muris]|uniref:hypothetical protein n=1 Tax=Flintibacter muris TaxID=2941327 RepID=UPI003B97A976